MFAFYSQPDDLPDLVDPDSSDTSRNYSDEECVPDLVEMGTSEDSDDSDNDESEVRNQYNWIMSWLNGGMNCSQVFERRTCIQTCVGWPNLLTCAQIWSWQKWIQVTVTPGQLQVGTSGKLVSSWDSVGQSLFRYTSHYHYVYCTTFACSVIFRICKVCLVVVHVCLSRKCS